MRIAVVTVLVVALGLAAASGAEPPTGGGEATLEAQLAALEHSAEARQVAGSTLEQCKQALRRSAGLKAAGDEAGARRARQIAGAALQLAQRQVALEQEEAAHRLALERLRKARLRAEAAKHALSLAREQLQDVRQQAAPAAPAAGPAESSSPNASGEAQRAPATPAPSATERPHPPAHPSEGPSPGPPKKEGR